MSERIKLLAEQAKQSMPNGLLVERWIELYNQKFAELIIQECISACATDQLGKTIGAEELIKKHFGVE